MIVVIGHVNPDLDSVAAAIMEAKRLCLEGKAARAFVSGIPTREVESLLHYLHLSPPPQWDDTLTGSPTVAVDFNDLEQAPGKLDNVIAVVDHHHDCGDLAQVSDRLIAAVGSTATLIARRYLADRPADLSTRDCFLLLAAIISDTKSLLSPQTTAEDKQLAEQLAARCDTSVEQMIELVQDWGCFRFTPASVREYMTQSVKCNTINGHLICSAAIETVDLQPFLLHRRQIAAELHRLGGEVRALIVTDLKQRRTAVFHNGVLPLASPYVLDGICLRKQEIRLLLEEHLPRREGQT